MSVNSSSSPNVSILPPLLSSSNSSLHPLNFRCSKSTVGALIFMAFTVTNFLLVLPLSICVLYLGLQRWRRQRSVSAMTSHSDLFTYHMVAMELIGFLAYGFYCCGMYMNLPRMLTAGHYAFAIMLPGEILLHCLTCVERYLAVVHPITYLGLRNRGGVRVRNISIGCVWLLCLGGTGLTALYSPAVSNILLFCLFAFSLLLISFCSLSVLRALIRPGPGEVGGDRERVDQSKQRAFYTIMAIMGVLSLKFSGLLVCSAVNASTLLSDEDECVVVMSEFWFGLPSSLVLPLLFLHRAGKLACCMRSVESE